MKRPYHIWDDQAGGDCRWHYYASVESAHNGALKMCRWLRVRNTLTVYNHESGRRIMDYTRRLDNSIHWS